MMLFGNDYCPRLKIIGPMKIMSGSIPRIPRGMSKDEEKRWKKSQVWKDDSSLD